MAQVQKWVRGVARGMLTGLLLLWIVAPAPAAFRSPPQAIDMAPGSGSGYTLGQSVQVNNTWCDADEDLDSTSLNVTVFTPDDGGGTTNVTSAFTWQEPWQILECAQPGAKTSGSITLKNGDNVVTALVRDDFGDPATKQVTYTVAFHGVSVTPDGTNVTHDANTTGHTQTFTITNTSVGTGAASYSIGVGCQSPVTNCRGYATSTGSVAEQAATTVTVTYDTDPFPATNGTITVTATKTGTPSGINDTGSISLTTVAGQQPPFVALFAPPADTVLTPTLQASADWCDLIEIDQATHLEQITRPDGTVDPLVGVFAWDSTHAVIDCGNNPPLGEGGQSAGTITLEPGRNALTYTVRDNEGNLGKDSVVYFLRVDGVRVTPDSLPKTRQAGLTVADTFTVMNITNVPETFSFSATCSGSAIVAGSCAVGTASALVAADSATVDVVVTYDTGASGTGTVELRATATGPSGASDTGSFLINIPTLLVNPTPNFDRSLCLTVNMGGGAIAQCGDLVIAHPLPSTRTWNRTRTPTLLYNRATNEVNPMVAARVTLPVGDPIPDSMQVVLKLGGNIRNAEYWPGSLWTPGAARRLTIRDDPNASWNMGTGVKQYVLEVAPMTNNVAGTALLRDTIPTAVVNRRESRFGRGWWLAGLEQLVYQPGDSSYLWVGGDASTRWYEKTGNPNEWATAMFDRPDTLKLVAGELVRELKGGARVYFDLTGNHIRTEDRLQHATQFSYNGSGDLATITLPVPPGAPSRVYDFGYTTIAGGQIRLTSVTAPPIGATLRVTAIAQSAPALQSITDPDGGTSTFGWGLDPLRITYREDPAGVRTSFLFHAETHKLQSSRVHMVDNATNDATDIVTTMTTHEAQTYPPLSVDPDSVYTLVDGPRTDVADTTAFHIDYGTGAPRVIVNALGDSTQINRGGVFPALVSEVVRANGHTMTASYNPRGNVQTVADLFRGGTTTYEYADTVWLDFVTKVTPPTQTDFVEIAYDATTGSRIWQQDARGPASRVNFRYYGGGLHDRMLRAIQAPLNGAAESDTLTYDNQLGNTQTAIGPTGSRNDWVYDPVGQISQIQTELDTLAVPQINEFQYDVLGRDTLNKSTGPPTPLTPGGEVVTVLKHRDAVGRVERVTRTFTPDPQGIGSLVTMWTFDRAGRVLTETDPQGQVSTTAYDQAGNVTTSTPRHLASGSITMMYDALNRLTQRNVPAFHNDSIMDGIPGFLTAIAGVAPGENSQYPRYPTPGATDMGYDTPADTQLFTYDVVGNLKTANNWAARVSRAWNPDGTLASETLDVAEVIDTTFNSHVYTTGYTYDIAGRLKSIAHPSVLAPSAPYTTSYGYDALTGGVDRVTDPEGNVYEYTYDLQSRIDSVKLSGGLTELYEYYADGALKRHQVHNANTQAPNHSASVALQEFVWVVGRGGA